MSIGSQNEITVRVLCSEEELIKKLINMGFEEVNQYMSSDTFMVPNEIDIEKEKTREILKKAVLLRESKGINNDKQRKRITFKHKEIDNDEKIISQYSVNCDVYNLKDAQEIFEHIGYKELMKITEKHISFKKGNLKLVIKIVAKDNILIEIETNEYYDNVERLKYEINKIDIPFDKSNYFVKKAEEELEKLKR